MPKQKDDRKFGTVWLCPNCEGKPEFENAPDFKEHLKTAHNIDLTNKQYKRSMTMHVDGAGWFASQYKWDIEGLEFLQSVTTKRDKAGRMMWGG